MVKLENFITGKWIAGDGEGQALLDAVNGETIAHASTKGIDFASVLNYARNTGNPALRKMTFHERGRMLKALALHLQKHLAKFYTVSYKTGATKADSWIDIEGGIGNLFSYASLRKKFNDDLFYVDGEPVNLGKAGSFIGHHILVPKEGVAIHINAYNFPVWGMLEKIAVNLLAGVPAVVKPATITSFLTETVVREIAASEILPKGALQLICGSAGDMLDHVQAQDVITFTGSASTGVKLKTTPAILTNNVPFNLEADSLNCIVLGSDVQPGMLEWDIFLKEVRKEMTVKAGQKCTAVRRIFVPENKMEDVWIAIGKSLSQTTIGNPENEKVRMGALAGLGQREEVRSQVQKLLASSEIVYGSLDSVELIDADNKKGAFMSPLLLKNDRPFESEEPHNIEAFGPVSTIMPYKDNNEAILLANKGKGSLVCSIVTADNKTAREFVYGAATHHGRILILNNECAKESTGHGSPLPSLVHGGPGRAGGGEEMGGIRGVKHYMQRVAVQGSPSMLTAVTNVYHQDAAVFEDDKHPFRKYFEELRIGDTVITQNRTVTEADIVNFANISWDHFYAHIDHTSLEGTIFEKPVAHGYFVLSAAAGLFVDGKKGPVLLNYGIEECRFLKPVYAGTTIGVKLTCKEKTIQDQKDENDIPKGIVKWLVEVKDQLNEHVAIATILTMVRRKKLNYHYMNGEGYVKAETHQSVTTIEFYHPLSNSLPASILHKLAQQIHVSGEDFNTRVIVLRSAGSKAFCAGAAFDELAAIDNKEKGLEFFSGFAHVINAMRKCPKLIIGRIHGKCVGGGVGIAAAVDYAIALEGAEVKLSELAIGFGPFVIAPAVERKIGLSAFSSLAIDATLWRNAEWALRKGLYSELHQSTEALDEAVSRQANALAHFNPEAMTELKQILWKGTEHWDKLLPERAAISGRLVLSEFAKAAINKIRK